MKRKGDYQSDTILSEDNDFITLITESIKTSIEDIDISNEIKQQSTLINFNDSNNTLSANLSTFTSNIETYIESQKQSIITKIVNGYQRIKEYVSMLETNLLPLSNSNSSIISDEKFIISLNKLNNDIKSFIKSAKKNFTTIKSSNDQILLHTSKHKTLLNECVSLLSSNRANKEKIIKSKLNMLLSKEETFLNIKHEISTKVKLIEKEIVKLFDSTKEFNTSINERETTALIDIIPTPKTTLNNCDEILITKSNLNHSFNSNDKVSQLEKKNEQLENENQQLKSEIKRSSSCIDIIKRNSIKDIKDITLNENRINEIVSLKASLSKKDDECNKLIKENDTIKKEISKKENSIQELKSKLTAIEAEKKKMNEIISSDAIANKINDEYTHIKEEFANLNAEYIKEKTEKEKLITNSKSMALSLKDTLTQIAQLKKDLLHKDKSIREIESLTAKKYTDIISQKDTAISLLSKEKEDSQRQIDQLIRELNIARSSII